MVATTLSRRVSEILGITLFAGALVWLVSLTTYDAGDAVWFFNPDGVTPPVNLVGRVGAFVAELSYQLVGLTAFLIPVQLLVLAWHAFWCRPVGAAYTKLLGLGVLVGCSAGFLSLAFGHLAVSPRPIAKLTPRTASTTPCGVRNETWRSDTARSFESSRAEGGPAAAAGFRSATAISAPGR